MNILVFFLTALRLATAQAPADFAHGITEAEMPANIHVALNRFYWRSNPKRLDAEQEAAESEIALALDYLKSEPMTEYDGFKTQKAATTKPTTDIKPTNNNEPTTAAGMPPEQPAATEKADAADAGMMAGVRGCGQGAGAFSSAPRRSTF